ncbi:hypothetical protein CV945_03455 [Geobacillus sp. Manikaran-105]|nr:hypothetical protein CV945_03455 [Geobacillus sp. Manikaran-105]PJW18524.1 hypothetical protein CV944_03400 [Geobacillus sp. WSUCF-018B]
MSKMFNFASPHLFLLGVPFSLYLFHRLGERRFKRESMKMHYTAKRWPLFVIGSGWCMQPNGVRMAKRA